MTNINITQLEHHPLNPRKECKDLEELAGSIGRLGVLQPLTVVRKPDSENYYVVIGNRRLAAARTLNDESLMIPCEVKEIGDDEIVNLMLVENMQRENLTAFEEANGFQTMLDMGKSVADISRDSGFSETTVRRRTKLSVLDKEKFSEATDRGATLFELGEIAEFEDEKTREKLLKSVGTKNWANELSKEKDNLKEKAVKETIYGFLANATKIDHYIYENGISVAVFGDGEDAQKIPLKNVKNYTTYSSVALEPFEVEEGADYYYTESTYNFTVFKRMTEEELAERDNKISIMDAKRTLQKAKEDEMSNLANRMYQLRKNFVAGLANCKKKAGVINKAMLEILLKEVTYSGYGKFLSEPNKEYVNELLSPAEDNILSTYEDNKEYTSLVLMLSTLEGKDRGYFRSMWKSEYGFSVYVNSVDEKLDIIYRILEALGYEKCDEEEQLEAGTHPIFDDAWAKEFVDATSGT